MVKLSIEAILKVCAPVLHTPAHFLQVGWRTVRRKWSYIHASNVFCSRSSYDYLKSKDYLGVGSKNYC